MLVLKCFIPCVLLLTTSLQMIDGSLPSLGNPPDDLLLHVKGSLMMVLAHELHAYWHSTPANDCQDL